MGTRAPGLLAKALSYCAAAAAALHMECSGSALLQLTLSTLKCSSLSLPKQIRFDKALTPLTQG